jgi:hypothetical protein
MLEHHDFTYREALAASERVNWRVEDIIGPDKPLDFSKPFLPESLAGVMPLAFLSQEERLALNQIRGHGYLYVFGLVEEFILPFVIDHARPRLQDGDDYRTRALLRFAHEEAKHIHLFKRFREEFMSGFGHSCAVIGPPEAVARAVLSHHPLSVALATLHIEWMTQRHYLESVKDDQDLDPQFKSLLRHHWTEEAQHAKLDTLIVEALAARCSSGEIDDAVDGYLEIGAFLDSGLRQQVELDLDSLEAATGRTYSASEQEALVAGQTRAMRWTFLGSGMSHPRFQATLHAVAPAAAAKVAEVVPAFA